MREKIYFHFKWILFCACFINFYRPGYAQNNFPLVGVPDTNVTVDITTEKVFTTSLRLFPVTTALFNPTQFSDFIQVYYLGTLNGFSRTENIVQTTVPGENFWQVRYQIVYIYNQLFTTTDDAGIASTIGNSEHVANGIETPAFAEVYQIDSRNTTFSFSGLALCNGQGVSRCATNTACEEVLAGITIMCVSPCKQGFCQNGGTCAQASTAVVPTCTCTSTSDTWHIGENCETKVTLWMIIVPVVIGFLLIVFAIVVACCCYHRKKKQKEKESMFFDASKDTAIVTKTNEAFVEDEEKKTPVEFIPREGYEERDIDAALSRKRTRSTSRDRSRRRRHSSEYSRRDRRSRRRRSGSSRRHSRRRRSEEDSFESDSSGSQNDVESIKPKKAENFTSGRSSSDLHGNHRSSRRRHSETPSESSEEESSSSYEDSDDATSNDVSVREKGTSPIKWMPTSQAPSVNNTSKMGKIDIAQRKGWMPSLGPQMFDLGSQENLQDDNDDTLPAGTKLSPYVAETDI